MSSLDTTTTPELAGAIAYLEDRLRRANASLETEQRADVEPMEDAQKLLALSLRLFVSNYHAGWEIPVFGEGHGVSATDVMIACTEMLKAVNVQLFELGMFQTWSKH